MGGGGGGDGGYQARQDEIERKKQAARARLNAMFGISTAGPASSSAVSRPGFLNKVGGEVADSMAVADAADTSGTDDAAANKAARDQLYSQVRDNAFTAGKRGFDEQKTSATRNNKFALFANGLQGGSVDVDQSALLDRTYKQGLLDLGAKADATKADMMGNDEQTRLGLLQSIDAGMDEGSALSSAMNQMKVNSDRATAQAQGTALGDLFGNAGLLYTKNQASQGAQAAGDWWKNYNRGRSTPSSGASGSVYNGRI